MIASSLLLFGPQSPRLSQAYLSELRTSIIGSSDLSFLVDTIRELPSLWPTLQQACPHLSRIPGAEQLDQLGSFLESETTLNVKTLNSILLAPLTVISQIVEYSHLGQEEEGSAVPALFEGISKYESVQGFCIGFLAAAVVACSRNKTEFQHFSSIALRLAVCIGSIIDLDEIAHPDPLSRSLSYSIRWSTESEHAHLEGTLSCYSSAYISCVTDKDKVTVTVPSRDASSFAVRVTEGGLAVQSIGLHGRFHCSVHVEAVQHLKDLFKQDSRFQLPTAGSVISSLRSNSDAKLITKGALHNIALDSILIEQSQWFRTVQATVAAMKGKKINIIPIGTQGFVPRSVTTESSSQAMGSGLSNGTIESALERTASELTNGSNRESGIPNQASFPYTRQIQNDLSTKDAAVSSSQIAVIGMACRFPKAESLEKFWELISSGGCAVQAVPKNRFDTSELWRDPKGPFWGNFLREPDAFDHRFFHFSSREAKSMDPQQRLLLQVAYEAMESSGYCGDRSDKQPSDIGCYVGVGAVDYEYNVASHNATAFSATGTLRAFVSGKVSHHFGWSGPSITYDTACSSSAVAIHSACKALQTNECSMAIAGGVNVITSPALYQNLAAASFLSPTGASKAFDADANGYCRGEGAGLVVLKTLANAVADGDFVLGIIAGSAVNQGSNCTPITVPCSQSQSALYRQALSTSDVQPTEVSYVEAHGTGTRIGDPIECESIRHTFGGTHRSEELFLGSVKDNIGHIESASGVAALLKTILMMQNRTIPKQANFSSLNPDIPPLERDRMTIAKQSQTWTSKRLTAVVNNYGAAGNNAAILLREPPLSIGRSANAKEPSVPTYLQEFPFLVTAASPESLRAYCVALRSFLARSQGTLAKNALANVAYNLSRKQNRAFEYSWTSTASTFEALSDRLEKATVGLDCFSKIPKHARSVVLCFGGQSGQTVNLSEDLFHNCKLLRTHLVECDSKCRALGLESIFPRIFQTELVEDIVSLHCMLFSLQYACAKSWLDCGLKVETMIGHSFGQLTALCVADCLSLSDGIRLISGRARLIQDHWGPETGIMLSIEGDLQEIEGLLTMTKKKHPSYSAEIACYNGPRNFVLAGSRASIGAIEEVSGSEGFTTRLKLVRLRNTHAFHSQYADRILPGLVGVAESMSFREPSIPIETCSMGSSWSKIGADEVVQHTRLPVYFSEAVERVARRLKSSIWLEAGSGSPILAMIRRVLKVDSGTQHILQPIDLGSPNAQNNLAKASCELWAAGSKAQYWSFHRCQGDLYTWLNLPPYQFDNTKHWMEHKSSACVAPKAPDVLTNEKPELLRLLEHHDGESGEALFSVDSTHEILILCTKGHAVLNHSLCPASMYFELAVRAAHVLTSATSSSTVPQVQDLKISSPLGLAPIGRIFLQLRKVKTRDETWDFSLFSRRQQDAADHTTHANGTIALVAFDSAAATSRFQSLKRLVGNSRCEQILNSPVANGLNGPVVYKVFARVVEYARYYHGVLKISARENEAVGYVSVPEDQPPILTPSCCDPIAIDNFLQVAGIHVNCLSECKNDEVFMCTAIGELTFSQQFMNGKTGKRSWTVFSNFEPTSPNRVVNDIFVLDSDSGNLVLTLMGAVFTSVPLKSLSKILSKLNGFQQLNPVSPGTGQTEMAGQRYTQPDGLKASRRQNASDGDSIVPNGGEAQGDQTRLMERVQDMLGEVMEIPTSEIQPGSALSDLGVDSLMITEVLSEIKQRFNVAISVAEFQAMTDLQSLCHRIQPSVSIKKHNEHNHRIQPPVSIKNSNEHNHPVSTTRLTNSLAIISRDCLVSSRRTFDSFARETGFIGFCSLVYPAQAELVVAYVVEAFTALGCPLASLRPGQSLPDIHCSTKHTKLKNQLYKILEDAHVITRSRGEARRAGAQVPRASAQDLQNALVVKFPKHASEHQLLHTTGRRLAGCLTEVVDPLSLLFRDAKARRLLEDVYTNAPMFKSGTIFLAQYLVSAFHQFDSEQEVQVLEIGAGTGGTTNYLIDSLIDSKQWFRYTFTDVSSSMVGAAKKKFARHSFMEYAILDIEQDPPAHFLDQFDIIISTNCIHATKILTKSCTNIKSMLRRDGVLCLVELTRNLFWFDLVFGLLEGWWLFEDGREHVLADETLWKAQLRRAGFQWVDWSEGGSQESRILRVIVASPSKGLPSVHDDSSTGSENGLDNQETVIFKQEQDTQLFANIYYPEEVGDRRVTLPVALMIHGGGHVMLSREDVRPRQTQILLEAGFLPVSVDYRLCPETTLLEGPMHDVCEALKWARDTLPSLHLKRRDICVNGDQVVAVGWSTGGHLAMTLAWTAPAIGIKPPQAILSFYGPTDYEDSFWTRPNVPGGAEIAAAGSEYYVWEGVYDKPITAYNVPATTVALGGWMAPSDPRSRIALHMNWKGQTLPVLLYGLTRGMREKTHGDFPQLPTPTAKQIASISPLAQIRRGTYETPTFLVHGTLDDLIPWQQSQRTCEALIERGVEAEVRVVEGAVHLFDVYRGFEQNRAAAEAVNDGYNFLRMHVGLE